MSESLALLLTDVVDSTQLNEELGDAVMAQLWRAHDSSARELIRAWRGQEVARSDGFLVAFERADDAVGFACAYHRALRALDTRLRARVGVHVGPATLRPNSELDRRRGAPAFEIDGVSLPVAARVMATALGGQTLLTANAVQALRLNSLRVKDHGHWRLKGVAEPVELYEVGDQDAPFEPPPDSGKAYRVVRTVGEWVPTREIANNLPAERDPFVGRDHALQQLARFLDGSARLVTVLGIGGIGKTRLALRHARTWLGNYPGGAWFCDLSPARDVEGIVLAVSRALELQLGTTDSIEQIGTAIAARGSCLILLDNFEQVARHAETVLGPWLARAPEAKFIVTSREVLGIAGEQAQVLAPLSVEDGSQLFVRRASAASQRPAATAPGDGDTIGKLVTLLDGLPLGIELAAARSRVMSPRMLLERMNERFTLLASRGGRVDRQVTLRATLDWSWELLTPDDKSALAQLSVFEGGFTLEAVESVLRFSSGNPSTALDMLQSLFDKSFVRQVGEDRFDLLQTVQEYARGRLRAMGTLEPGGTDAIASAEAQHGAFFAGLSEESVTGSRCIELDNLSAACRRAVARGDRHVATRTLALAWAALELRGPFTLGVELASAVLSIADLAGHPGTLLVRAAALSALGKIAAAQSSSELALESARQDGDRACEGEALMSLGNLSANAGHNAEARAQLSAALGIARSLADEMLECKVLNSLGSLSDALGRTAEARIHYESALAIARRAGNTRYEGGILGNLGNVQYAQGAVVEAVASFETGLAVARQIGNKKWEGNALCNLGLLAQLQGKPEVARVHLEQSLQVARELGHARLEAIVLCNLGIAEEGSGDLPRAREHQEAALAVARQLADRRSQGQILGYLGVLHTRLGAPSRGRECLSEGKLHLKAVANELDLALVICQSAEAFALQGAREDARAELSAAERIAERWGGKTGLELPQALERMHALLDAATSDG
jgi:predicted ATPase/class 3 adenylate cyclase/Tfp pilus assembly protein PilF